MPNLVRPCTEPDLPRMLEIVNAAAEAYRGAIPLDRWHEPYMSESELKADIAAGIQFRCCWEGDDLLGLMGIQPVRDVHLIRHAYVKPGIQRGGVGTILIEDLMANTGGQILVGTWAAASWAIRFYEKNGFTLVSRERTPDVLRTYWNIPERQIETSVVLARPPLANG